MSPPRTELLALAIAALLLTIALNAFAALIAAPPRASVPAGPWAWPGEAPAHWPQSTEDAFSSYIGRRRSPVRTDTVVDIAINPTSPQVYEHQRIDIGFPFRCARADLRVEHDHETNARAFPTMSPLDTGVMLDQLVSIPHRGAVIPLRPLPLGLLANTLCMLVILLLARAASRAARAKYRSQHKLCPDCGYPDPGESRCPECGDFRATQRGAS